MLQEDQLMNALSLKKIFILCLLILVSIGCSTLKKSTPTISVTQVQVKPNTIEVVTTPPQPTDLPLVVPSATAQTGLPCATPTEFELLFTLDDPATPYGLCFLYPSDFTVTQSEVPDTWYFTGTPYGSGEMVAATVELHIESANGKMLEQYASDAVIKAAPGLRAGLDLIYLMPDDVPAMKIEGLPGLISSRTLYLVHNNTAFIFTFMPIDPSFEDAWIDMERAYSALTSTWTFTR
jgi:hypothetical protein